MKREYKSKVNEKLVEPGKTEKLLWLNFIFYCVTELKVIGQKDNSLYIEIRRN